MAAPPVQQRKLQLAVTQIAAPSPAANASTCGHPATGHPGRRLVEIAKKQ